MDLILEHNKRPRNFGHLKIFTHQSDGINKNCGDQLHLEIKLENGNIADIAFVGQGCALCMASASMMTESIKGKPINDAKQFSQQFKEFVKNSDKIGNVNLGKLAIFSTVGKFPARVKCVTLPWNALDNL